LKINKRLTVTAFLLIVIAVVSFYVWAEDRREQDREALFGDLERFSEVVEKIMNYYVDEIDSEELIDAAIKGMLEKLDPHSIYLSKHQLENLMIETKGEFGGLGIQLSIRDKFPTVIAPIEETPAYRLGIQGGDRIVEIETASTKGWSSEETVSKLRGRPGTQVNITISREGLEDSLYFAITREIIKVPSITYWDTIEDVGYVRVSRFAERTADELDEIVSDMEKEGVKGLVLDLRSNPGGLLSAARDVSELFLERGELIVYTESRIPSHNVKYKSSARNIHHGYPIVVLVNGASASASEIVAGALQDWDRGLIIGSPTFGKGSVQTVFKIGGGASALKLTTQKYFTPSGRSIHKDEIEEGEEARIETEEAGIEEYRTSGGRIVYGGGGITPDWIIEPSRFTELQQQLEVKGVFFSFAVHFTAYHDVDESFEVDQAVLDDFREYLGTKKIEVAEDEWTDENIDYVKIGIKREVFRKLFGTRGAYIATLPVDETLNKVLDMFHKNLSLPEMFSYVKEQEELAKKEKE
jgi:carboxyl-terminal processing protease